MTKGDGARWHVRVLNRICERAKKADVTQHRLCHTFAGLAGGLGFSELTIAGGLAFDQAPQWRQGSMHIKLDGQC